MNGSKNHIQKNGYYSQIILGQQLSLDETELSNGDLYTILTNKAAEGRKNTIVAMINGTKTEDIVSIINKIPAFKRDQVTEVTVDMVNNMNAVVRESFNKEDIVIDI